MGEPVTVVLPASGAPAAVNRTSGAAWVVWGVVGVAAAGAVLWAIWPLFDRPRADVSEPNGRTDDEEEDTAPPASDAKKPDPLAGILAGAGELLSSNANDIVQGIRDLLGGKK